MGDDVKFEKTPFPSSVPAETVIETEEQAGGEHRQVVKVGEKALYEVKVDTATATITYIGKAAPGTSAGAEEWQILRIDTSVLAADILYADGDTAFDNEWDERAGLSYGP